ncbi:MAG TPA: acyl carrier protein [Gammaproteobacteria bacterium]|nr:acyl carrier protein [Gammaproteobacteria bacterium]
MSEPHSALSRINDLFEHTLGLPAPGPDTDLFDSGSIDSLDFAELLIKLEEEFGFHVSFEEMDMDRFRSMSRIAGYLSSYAH